MDLLSYKYRDKIKGVLEGFDRIVFKGILRPISFAAGMQMYLNYNKVLNKGYKEWALGKTSAIISDAEKYTMEHCGADIQYLSSCHVRKEELAHAQQEKSGTQSGLIGTWSCVESCNTFKAAYDKEKGFPQIRHKKSRCKHLYFYYDHEDYGFMSIRLQTWAPYELQVAMNGREWLRRLLDKSGAKYLLDGNKFLWVEDYDVAQRLLDSQLDTRWVEALSGLLPDIFPSMQSLFSEDVSYTWTLWQSEWAKDYIFGDPRDLGSHMANLLRHAFITGTGDRVLRYFGHPVRPNGQPHWLAKPELQTRLSQWYDGSRIRHWFGKNSLKVYNEQNVLRFEFTMNDPTRFLIRRTVEGSDEKVKKLLPMRKGIADIVVRTQICSARIKNLTEQMATLEEDQSVGEILSRVTQPTKANGKRFRGLDVTGKDLVLLQAIADPKFNVDAITNKQLQKDLGGSAWAKCMMGHRLSARIGRHLRLMREHGLIKKLPKQHRYILTDKGRLLTTALIQFLGAKISDLSHLVA
jgi:hypothetical protein